MNGMKISERSAWWMAQAASLERVIERLTRKLQGLLLPANLALAIAVILGFALRAYRISEPYGGFMSYNEAFYASLARGYLDKGLLSVILSPGDYNNPPLYSFLLVLSFKVFGVGEAAARAVGVLASALSIVFLFKLAKTLYNEKIAILAAFVLAFTPGHVLVGRNVQPEALLMLLVIASLYFYVRGVKEGRPLLTWVGGLLLGLGILTKLQAILLIPPMLAWETWRRRNLKWVLDPHILGFTTISAFSGLSWYLFHFLVNRGAFIEVQSRLLSTFQIPNAYFLEYEFYRELIWLLSPPLFIAFVASFAWLLYRRQLADLLVVFLLIVNAVFYFFYHYHTYYLIPVAPFAAIAVARGIYSVRITSWKRVMLASALITASSIFFTLLLLAGVKYGMTELAQLESIEGLKPEKLTIEVGSRVMGNFGPVLKYYVKRANLIGYPPLPREKTRTGDEVVILNFINEPVKDAEPYLFTPKRTRVVLFGYAFSQTPPFLHAFKNGDINIERIGRLFDFGLDEVPGDSLFIIYRPRKL
ncbi:MAG: glycosyltransferase family 39 protein [Actinobacteria bacterium]|nr:glycosyltransferase family 39 protein [Actinomycetota bacterium]